MLGVMNSWNEKSKSRPKALAASVVVVGIARSTAILGTRPSGAAVRRGCVGVSSGHAGGPSPGERSIFASRHPRTALLAKSPAA